MKDFTIEIQKNGRWEDILTSVSYYMSFVMDVTTGALLGKANVILSEYGISIEEWVAAMVADESYTTSVLTYTLKTPMITVGEEDKSYQVSAYSVLKEVANQIQVPV